MRKKLPIGRTIACVVAVALVVVAVLLIVEAHRIKRKIDVQSRTRPLDLPVDFSQPGEFRAPFKQTWSACHGQTISLHAPTGALAEISPQDLRASLKFTWQIVGSDGRVVTDDMASGHVTWGDRWDGEAIPLAYFHPFDRGEYTFSCTVVTGAPELAGLEQRLVCEYRPCGLEMMPVFVGNVMGGVALLVAAIILLVVWGIAKRRRKRAAESPDLT